MQKMNDKRRRKIEHGVETLRHLLEKMDHRPIGTDLLIAAAKDESGLPDLLTLLVRHNGTLAAEEDVILAVARNPYHKLTLATRLFRQRRKILRSVLS